MPTFTAQHGHGRFRLLLLSVLLSLSALFAWPGPALGQAATESAPEASDIYGRTTPRKMLEGLLGALSRQDYVRAAQYFELAPGQSRSRQGADIARRLQAALDAGGSLTQPLELSNDPGGRIDDQLPTDQEQIGELKPAEGTETIPLIIRSVKGPETRIWLLSSRSLAQLNAAAMSGGGTTDAIRAKLPPYLRTATVAGAPLADWVILLATAVLAYLLVRLICTGATMALTRVHPLKQDSLLPRLIAAAPAPLSLWVSMLLFLSVTRSLEVAIVARQLMNRIAGAIAFVAFAWFLWRLVDFGAEMIAARMEHNKRLRARSIIIFARRAIKLVILLIAGIQALNILGIDVTTGLAALGIGGIAIALGAQKTVENLVGSVSVIADEPVRVGDFCKVGDVSGTVEEIGIRSTRIRTNDRTRVTIPNGSFSSLQIENFAPRDRFLFTPLLRLDYDIEPDGIAAVLESVRTALAEAEYLYEGARANLKGLGEYSIDIEIWSYLRTSDATDAAYMRERLLLALMRAVESGGGRLAVPTRSVRLPEAAEEALAQSGPKDSTHGRQHPPRATEFGPGQRVSPPRPVPSEETD